MQILRLSAALCLVVLLTVCAGCSRVSIAYNTADFLIEAYAKDYLALEISQIAPWRERLEDGLARHRKRDLPYLARFFDTAYAGATGDFDAQRMNCLLDQFEDLYRRHLRLAVVLASPLLASLTPDQIDGLEEKFRAEKAEDEADLDPASVERRDRKRGERFGDAIAWWLGYLTEEQMAIVSEEAAAIPDTTVAWIGYRTNKRELLIEMLARQADESEIRDFLTAWLVEYEDLPADLNAAKGQVRGRISALFIRLDDTLETKQRAHYARRLAQLRDDFLSLQRHPRMGFVPCAEADRQTAPELSRRLRFSPPGRTIGWNEGRMRPLAFVTTTGGSEPWQMKATTNRSQSFPTRPETCTGRSCP